MVHITINGRPGESIDYADGGNTILIKDDLYRAFGPGMLKQNNLGVLTETLTGNYEYHLSQRGN